MLKECDHCVLLSGPETTDTPFHISRKDRKRRCITCTRNGPRHWYLWDTAVATARLLFSEFREYHLANLRAMPPNELTVNGKVCTMCLSRFFRGCRNKVKCTHCSIRPPSCITPEMKEWSLTQFQPNGGHDTWFREKVIYLRNGIRFILYFTEKLSNTFIIIILTTTLLLTWLIRTRLTF